MQNNTLSNNNKPSILGDYKMKMIKTLLKTVTALSLLGGITSYAQATNVVYSVNMVGFQKNEVGATPKMIASPFVKEGTNSLATLLADQASVGIDRVFTYEPGVGFREFLHFGSGDWRENVSGFPPAVDDLIPGTGFIFVNNDASTNDVVIVGEVVQAAVVTNTIPSGLSIFSNPYSSDLDLNATNVTLKAALSVGTDRIYTLSDGGYVAYLNNGSDIVEAAPPFTNPIPVIPSGTAFWIENAGAAKDWVQNTLY